MIFLISFFEVSFFPFNTPTWLVSPFWRLIVLLVVLAGLTYLFGNFFTAWFIGTLIYVLAAGVRGIIISIQGWRTADGSEV